MWLIQIGRNLLNALVTPSPLLLTSYVVPSKPTSDDASCRFTVHKQADKTILLQASNGNYACRKDSGWSFQPIEADVSTPISSCSFKVHNLPNGKVALQADNRKFLSRVLRGSNDHLEAYKNDIDYIYLSSVLKTVKAS